jgi:hypothetical protein
MNESRPQVRYTTSGRGGTVYYTSTETNLEMWWEFAGGNALAIIDVPTPERWEAVTRTALSRRDPILRFIGEQVVKDQTMGNGTFKIEDNAIVIYSRK